MNKMEEIVTITMSELDYLLILHIKELRIKHNLSQVDLSHKMKLSSGFIGKVELLTSPDKYSIRHLKLLAEIFGSKNIGEIFPPLPQNDLVSITLRITNNSKKDGSISKKKITEVINIEPIKNKQD